MNKSRQESHQRGSDAELQFGLLAMQHGHFPHKTSTKMDRRHCDYILHMGKKDVKIDVKARKKRARHQESYDDELTWVEIRNVRGDEGWLHGSADFIAFQTATGFSFVDRLKLIEVVNEKVGDTMVSRPQDALYQLYRRFDRPKELVTMLKWSDIPVDFAWNA